MPGHQCYEDDQAKEKIDQGRGNAGERNDQARKIYFPDEFRIADQAGGATSERLGKIGPGQHSHEREYRIGQPFGGHAGKIAEDRRKDQDGEHRLDDCPRNSQSRLFVANLDFTPDKKTAAPDIPKQNPIPDQRCHRPIGFE